MREQIQFLRQTRRRFKTTGAIAPSSRFLAGAMTRYLDCHDRPAHILEIGPGTGAVTRRIVRLMKPQDRLDLVELNDDFAAMLERRFRRDASFRRVAEQTTLSNCSLQDFRTDLQYDFVVSGLPLNNFSAEMVQDIFEIYFRLLAPGGVLSYFEYMYVRPVRKMVTAGDEKARLRALDEIMQSYRTRHHIRTDWVFVNVPPAWVQHLRNDDETTKAGSADRSEAKPLVLTEREGT